MQLDLDATVADNGFAADIPALDENEPPAEIGDLSTIDTDTLNRLCEEVQPAQTSPLVQPTRVANFGAGSRRGTYRYVCYAHQSKSSPADPGTREGTAPLCAEAPAVFFHQRGTSEQQYRRYLWKNVSRQRQTQFTQSVTFH